MECLAKNWVPAFAAEDHGTLADDAFNHAVGNGSFTFWWQPHGLKYGIRRSADDDVRFGRTIVCNVSRGIVPNLRMRYARVDAVLITAPVDVLSARLAGRAREAGDTLVKWLERNDTFTEFRADYVIENASAPEAAVQMLLDVLSSTNEGVTRRR
jgi:ribose 1,5-bisphosphokinase